MCLAHVQYGTQRSRKSFEAEVAGESNPTLRRRELGFLLRRLRTDRGLSIEEVAERAMFSETKLSRLETGRVGASPRDIRDLCLVYGITGTAERERLMALAREGKQRASWQQYDRFCRDDGGCKSLLACQVGGGQKALAGRGLLATSLPGPVISVSRLAACA